MELQTRTAFHWVRLTSRRLTGQQMVNIGERFGGLVETRESGAFHQSFATIFDRGYRVHHGKEGVQPRILEVPGEACEILGDDLSKLVRETAKEGVPGMLDPLNVAAVPSRVDVACDFLTIDPLASLHEMISAWKSGDVVTAARPESFDHHVSTRPGDGETACFGSKLARVFCRAYTRRGKLRVEFELKGGDMVQRFDTLRAISTKQAAELWCGAAARMCFNLPWFRQAASGDSIEIRPEPKETSLQTATDGLVSQYGTLLWSLKLLGYSIDDLAREPRLDDRRVRAKLRYRAGEAEAMGIDSSKLLEAIK